MTRWQCKKCREQIDWQCMKCKLEMQRQSLLQQWQIASRGIFCSNSRKKRCVAHHPPLDPSNSGQTRVIKVEMTKSASARYAHEQCYNAACRNSQPQAHQL